MNGPILTLLVSLHSVLTYKSNFWAHLTLDNIVFYENVTTCIKYHLNRIYAMDFCPKSLQEMKQKLY